ncbi:MAG TPA: ABC-F family ATP-binding cassette domain-containing protein [Acidimicrobiales bacterium]|nr:ABC-F family ATP-binding cassette domain-containing protein [Acidimicrobiales bacterium]
MISGSSLTIEIGNRVLVRDSSFIVNAGEKVGLVGRNGTGKSTLISVVVGESQDQIRSLGDIVIRGAVAYLPQVPEPMGLGLEPSGFSHVLSARGLDVLDDRLTRAREEMAQLPSEQNIQRFSDLEEEFRESGGYEVESVIAKLADGIGLDQELLLEDITGLSGGQRRRVDLIRVLFQQPDVMILDEPTNHLDLPAKKWLMDKLEKFSGALLVVSHDLKLLDRSITKVLHLSDNKLREFKGTYSSYRQQLEAEQIQSEHSAAHEDKEIKRLSTLADQMRGSTNRRARIAKGLDKRVERLNSARTEVTRRDRASKFRLPTPRRSGDVPLTVTDLSVVYDELKVLSSVNMPLRRGDRAVVIGRNGAGKSSLLRCLAGVQTPSSGLVKLGANVTLGYFAQEHEQVDPELTVLGNVDDSVLVTETERRSLLGSFGLSGKLVHQMPATLSGGERAKLGLAMLAAGNANLLILDEPTNNLDPLSITAVGGMLSRWSGTIVLVSHDRAFVEALDPTHALCLPEERYTYWKEEFLDTVEMK